MDAVTLKVAKNYTNEQAAQKATNSPVEEISFDGGIYSVGNNVVNGQVSAILKGRSLKNDFYYERSSLSGWRKALATIENNQIVFTGDGGNSAYALSPDCAFKASTKYGLILSIFSNDSGKLLKFDNNQVLTGSYTFGPTVGNKKVVFTTKSSISINRVDFHCYDMPNGTKLKFGDIRIFELPAGSEIEKDFDTTVQGATNLTTDQLAAKYPYINGDSVKSTNSVRVKSVGKNMFSDSEFNPSYWTKIGDGEFCNKIELIFYPPYVRWMEGKFKVNTVYTIKYSIKAPTGKNPRIKVLYTDGTSSDAYVASTGEYKTHTLVTENGKTVDYIDGVYTSSCNPGTLVIKDIQVEEGSVATEYEPYKESIVNVNLPEPLQSLPNGVKDEVNVSDGKLIKKIGSKVNVASGTVINYADMVTSGQFVAYYADGTQQVGLKGDTLTADAVTLTYQLATPIVTKLPAQAPLQVFENGTVYVEPIGDASESTLPTTELAIPIGTSNKFGVASHDYDGTAANWALTNNESRCFLLAVSNAGGAANIIAPDAPGVMYAISNASGYAITIKKSGGTGVAVTNAKTVLVIHNGADYTALTAEL